MKTKTSSRSDGPAFVYPGAPAPDDPKVRHRPGECRVCDEAADRLQDSAAFWRAR